MTLNQTPPMKIFCVRHWTGCTEDRRAGRQAAQKRGVAGCGKVLGELQKRAALWTALFRSPLQCAARRLPLMCNPLASPVLYQCHSGK